MVAVVIMRAEYTARRQHTAATPGARGVILHSAITSPSNYRATRHLDQWLKARGIIGLAGIDTRALTAFIREKGMPNAVIAHEPSSRFDLTKLASERSATTSCRLRACTSL
jgi:carbamoyl-phosphate synthase small subunit